MGTEKPLSWYAREAERKTTLPDLALGSWEAACVAGVHFTWIRRMVTAGKIVYRPMDSAWCVEPGKPQNEFLVYSLHDCDEIYRDYCRMFVENGGRTRYRPRSEECLLAHGPMLKRLADVPPILYDDAISTAQGSAIMGVHVTRVNELIRQGKVVARPAFNDRHGPGKGRVYIVSRRSCEESRSHFAALEKSGSKPGTKRGRSTTQVRNARVPTGSRKTKKKPSA